MGDLGVWFGRGVYAGNIYLDRRGKMCNVICMRDYTRERVSMDLAKQAKIVDSIHDTLRDFVGQRLKVRANMGRSKIVESEGVLMQVHPQLFIMEVDRKRGRTARQSYQYVDVLTGMVELSQNGEPLFEPFIQETSPVDSEKEETAVEEQVLS